MKFKNYFPLLLLLVITMSLSAQVNDIVPNEPQGPATVGTFDSMVYVPSIASRDIQPAPEEEYETIQEAQDGRSRPPRFVDVNDPQTFDDPLMNQPAAQSIRTSAPDLVFNAPLVSGVAPSDATMAVGPNHVIVTYNNAGGSRFIIYDRSGNILQAATPVTPAIFPSAGCCDVTVSYDIDADRWVLTYLFSGTSIAVSDGPDPINDGWFVYSQAFNDYQKLSIWSDGYYIAQNQPSGSQKVFALERDEMLAGNPSAQIVGFNLPGLQGAFPFYCPQFLNVSDGNMPAPGGATVVFLQDDAFGGVTEDHIKYWTVDMDWATIGNSTISAATEITTTPFISVFDGGSFSNLTQPPGGGPPIDALQNIIMNQAQFRKFGGHNSAVFTFVVDTDATAGELAGVRWQEFRQTADNQPWTLYQQGTYTSPDGKHAWNGSVIMDSNGTIGLGYSAMAGPSTPNPTDFRVGSYYTGRFDGDPLGTMTVMEEQIGVSNTNLSTDRYSDYNKLTLDPVNEDFWFINEVRIGGIRGIVGRFQLEEPLSIVDQQINNSELFVVTKANNQFEISMITGYDGKAQMTVTSMLGQRINATNLEKQGDRYFYNLDLSSVSAGVYVIKIGDESGNSYRTAKVVVR